jgi:potassium-dependent mechanosensitive channel
MRNARVKTRKILFIVLLSSIAVTAALFPARDAAGQDEEAPVASSKPLDQKEATRSLEKSVLAEQENLKDLKGKHSRLRETDRALDVEISAYNIQLSAQANLLPLGPLSLEDQEQALATNQASLESVNETLKKLQKKKDKYAQLLQQTEEQLALNQKQLEEIRAAGRKDKVTESLTRKISSLTDILSKKKDVLEKIGALCTAKIEQEEALRRSMESMSEKLQNRILEQRQQNLFVRDGAPLTGFFKAGGLAGDREKLAERARNFLSWDYWLQRLAAFWKTDRNPLVAALFFFGIVQALIVYFRRACERFRRKPVAAECPWTDLTIRLFQRSLHLLGTAAFLYGYTEIRRIYASDSLIRLGEELIAVWLFSRWGLDFLRLYAPADKGKISKWAGGQFRLLLRGARFFALVYCLLKYLLGDVGLLLLLRLLFGVALLAWNVRFWKRVRTDPAVFPLLALPKARSLRTVLTAAGTLFPAAVLIMDLAGFGRMALFGELSWAHTAAIVLWGALTFLSLREWDHRLKSKKTAEESLFPETRRPLMWLLARMIWLAWFSVGLLLLFFAWGAEKAFLLRFLGALNHPFTVGSMTLKLSGFIFAALILLFTHTASRLWRFLLLRKILARSGLEVGLQESIASVSIYLIWVLGILISLGVLGVSTTSLTVVFGALGVGLGFGLQAIFNNFVSGLILLFERPIQVGDAVEVNGVWGVVKKINVRSTVVQSADNASLIIPNSEFISGQVTNWSFKDLSLRRTIVVGVAYGSDTDLVRDTLLEIAGRAPHVLRTPEPDVLFHDFGDSALIFKLRVWTTIKNALVLESNLRYEIDRLFRTRKIEIAFPQRDVRVFMSGGEPGHAGLPQAGGETQPRKEGPANPVPDRGGKPAGA